MDHLIENSKDLRAQFNSHSIKLQQFLLSLCVKEGLGEGLAWEVEGKNTRAGGVSLAVQWLRLATCIEEGTG